MLSGFGPLACAGDTLRIATYNTELSRDGPGLLLRDIRNGRDPQATAVIEVIRALAPDILVLQNFDFDAGHAAASALQGALGAAGLDMPHRFLRAPNTGLPTGLDMDGDGRTGRADDAQGHGGFRGQGGLLILSRLPIDHAAALDFTALPWRDLPGATLPTRDAAPFPSPEAQAAQRLSSVAHWALPVATPDGPLWVLAFHATPPVFDGPEDRNGLRNADEIRFWQVLLDGGLGPAPQARFVIAGNANMDPDRGEGRHGAIRALVNDPRVTPLTPMGHAGANTVDWSDIGLGQRRVSYVLPSNDLRIVASGVFWPPPDDPLADTVARASRHRAVWADIAVSGAD